MSITMIAEKPFEVQRPAEYPKFVVTVSDGHGEIEDHIVQGAPKYRDSDWLEFTQRRNEQTHVVAAFPAAKVMSMIEHTD